MLGIVDGVNNIEHVNDLGTVVGTGNLPRDTNSTTERRIDLLDVIALNARSEIALGQWDDGCTSLAWNVSSFGNQLDIGGDASSVRQSRLLAQNWDWRTAVGPNLAIATITQEGKPDIWMVIEVCFAVHTAYLP